MDRAHAPGRWRWLPALVTILAALLVGCGSGEQAKPAGRATPKRTMPADAKDPKPRVVRVGTDAAYAPMEFVDDTGNITGFDVDLIHEVAKQAGFEVKVENVSWDALFGMLANGELDVAISSITITDERKKTMNFSQPYYKSGQRLILHSRHKDANLTLDGMDGMQVGAQIGTTSAELVSKNHPKVNLRTYENIPFGLRDLDQGNLDGFVVDDPVGRYYVSRGEYLNLVFTDKEYTSEEFGIVIRKGDEELVKLINEGLGKAKESGVVDQLTDKWLR